LIILVIIEINVQKIKVEKLVMRIAIIILLTLLPKSLVFSKSVIIKLIAHYLMILKRKGGTLMEILGTLIMIILK